jgi:phosphoglycolate phosphatase-like HAD superfamily hydrolase
MFLELAELHGIELRASTHVGDSKRDRESAASADVGTFVWAWDFFGWTG